MTICADGKDGLSCGHCSDLGMEQTTEGEAVEDGEVDEEGEIGEVEEEGEMDEVEGAEDVGDTTQWLGWALPRRPRPRRRRRRRRFKGAGWAAASLSGAGRSGSRAGDGAAGVAGCMTGWLGEFASGIED